MKYLKFLFVLLIFFITLYEYNSIFEALDAMIAEVPNHLIHMLSVWIILLLSFLLFHKYTVLYKNKYLSLPLISYVLYAFIINVISTLFLRFGFPSISSPALWVMPIFVYFATYVATIKFDNQKFHIALFTFTTYVLIYGYWMSYNIADLISHKTTIALISSYFCLYMFPLVLCSRNKILKIVTGLIISIIIISSLKRTGAVAFAMGLLVFFYLKTEPFSRTRRNIPKKIFFVILFVCACFACVYLLNNSDLGLFQRLANLGDDGGSGRDQIYRTVWTMIFNQDILGLIFGNGYNAVFHDSHMGMGAHNDFLEVLYDYGLIGFSIYCSIHYRLIKYVRYLSKSKSEFAPAMGMSYTLFFCASIFSQIVIYPFFMLIFFMSWAYFTASRELELLHMYD